MSNPAIVKITKQEVITSTKVADQEYVIVFRNEGVSIEGKRYSWEDTLYTQKDGTIRAAGARNFRKLYHE